MLFVIKLTKSLFINVMLEHKITLNHRLEGKKSEAIIIFFRTFEGQNSRYCVYIEIKCVVSM